jgi:hypothetical protein
VHSLSISSMDDDSAVLKLIFAKAVDIPPAALRMRLDSGSSSKRQERDVSNVSVPRGIRDPRQGLVSLELSHLKRLSVALNLPTTGRPFILQLGLLLLAGFTDDMSPRPVSHLCPPMEWSSTTVRRMLSTMACPACANGLRLMTSLCPCP